MTIRHLECALAAASAGSINNAAKKLFVSQPYLSGMINSLEKELGYTLFIRTNQGIVCTPEGEAFMSHAEKIMAEIAEIRDIGGVQDQALRVATYYSRFITSIFLEFHDRMPGAPDDRYREMGNMEVIDSVAKREYSLGIIYHAKSKSTKFRNLAAANNLEIHPLFDNMGTYLIMSDKHPLAEKDHITNEELKSSSLVFFDDESTILYMLEHLKKDRNDPRLSVSDRGAFTDALMSGRFHSVVNTPYPEEEKMFILKDIADCLPVDADIEVGSSYIIRNDHKLTKRERAFLDALMKR